MPHVLLICEYPTLNGGERSMLSTLPHIAAAGIRIQVAAPPTGDLAAELERRAIEHIPLDLCDARGQRLAQPAAREQIRAAILATRPDLVHANSLSMARLLGPVAAAEQIPSIGHIRDIIRLSRKAMDDVNQNTRLIAVSHATRDAHIANGLDASRTHVVHNGVDLDEFAPTTNSTSLRDEILRRSSECLDNTVRWASQPVDQSVEKQPLPERRARKPIVQSSTASAPLLVATIGQVIARKGTDLFIAAALDYLQNDLQQSSNAHFFIIGDCYSRKAEALQFVDNLHSTVERAGASSHIHFLGYRANLAELLPQIDLIVQPSRQDPLCRVLLESAACGLPIITTQVGGTAEIFPPNADAAILIPPDDTAALSEAITKLLNDPARRATLGHNARHRAAQAFDIRDAAKNLLQHYVDLLAC